MDLSRAVLLNSFIDWECPACGYAERTRPVPNRFHVCPRLHYITAPLVHAGSDCTLVATERQDYLGKEVQATGDDGVPYMNVLTIRADGSNDCAVHAPVARASLRLDD